MWWALGTKSPQVPSLFFVFVLIFWLCRKACGISVPRPGIEPASPASEGGFFTTGPPGKSLMLISKHTGTEPYCMFPCRSFHSTVRSRDSAPRPQARWDCLLEYVGRTTRPLQLHTISSPRWSDLPCCSSPAEGVGPSCSPAPVGLRPPQLTGHGFSATPTVSCAHLSTGLSFLNGL